MTATSGYTARIQIENRTSKPRMVWVEPWAEDFTLLPSESLEIIAQSPSEPPWFNLREYNYSTQVYLENVINHFEVIQNGNFIHCGHQRQAALDAGLKL